MTFKITLTMFYILINKGVVFPPYEIYVRSLYLCHIFPGICLWRLMILSWIPVEIGPRPSWLVKTRQQSHPSLRKETISPLFPVSRRKREIAGLEGLWEEKPTWQNQGFCGSISAILLWSVWCLVQMQWLACIEMKKLKTVPSSLQPVSSLYMQDARWV